MSLTPFEQALDADTALVTADAHGPGMDVIILAEDGSQHPVRAIFEQPGTDDAPGQAQAKVISSAPVLHIQVTAVQHALNRPLSQRDRFIIRGSTYRPMSPVSDGYGLVSVKLQEVKDAVRP